MEAYDKSVKTDSDCWNKMDAFFWPNFSLSTSYLQLQYDHLLNFRVFVTAFYFIYWLVQMGIKGAVGFTSIMTSLTFLIMTCYALLITASFLAKYPLKSNKSHALVK